MQVDDMVIYGERENVHVWIVRGIHLGAVGVESLVELENISHKPGWAEGTQQRMFVPECLLRQCRIGRAVSLCR